VKFGRKVAARFEIIAGNEFKQLFLIYLFYGTIQGSTLETAWHRKMML
jgi:hypothetical protein